MKKEKVKIYLLIWHKRKKLLPIGGPTGYLYNLSLYLKKIKL